MAPNPSGQTFFRWVAGIALVLGIWGITWQVRYSKWAVEARRWDVHVFQCHSMAPHAGSGALCGTIDHVSPPPPPPPWY